MISKKCNRCLEIKPIEEFHKLKNGKKFSNCKECRNKAGRIYRKNKSNLRPIKIPIIEKKCTHCLEIKPIEEFHRIGKRRRSKCAKCRNELKKNNKIDFSNLNNHPIQIPNFSIMKKCSYCNIEKSIEEFHKLKNGKRFPRCKTCRGAAAKIYRAKNPEYNKIYRANNLEKMNNSYKNWIINMHNSIFDLLGNECEGCGEKIKEFLTVDHIFNNRKQERIYHSYAWKKDIINGNRDLSQYQILCKNCNDSKQRMNPSHRQKRNKIGFTKICKLCLLNKDVSEFRERNSGNVKYRHECVECQRFKNIISIVKCCDIMGGKCVCCGISDYSKLHFDHVNNDGALRRSENRDVGSSLAKKMMSGKLNINDFQLMCANCNHSKFLNKGKCIHKIDL